MCVRLSLESVHFPPRVRSHTAVVLSPLGAHRSCQPGSWTGASWGLEERMPGKGCPPGPAFLCTVFFHEGGPFCDPRRKVVILIQSQTCSLLAVAGRAAEAGARARHPHRSNRLQWAQGLVLLVHAHPSPGSLRDS